MARAYTDSERAAALWARVDKNGPTTTIDIGPCWLWTGRRNKWNFGCFTRGLAHRLVWEITHGAIPPRALVLHHCGEHSCVNPAHLYLGATQTTTAYTTDEYHAAFWAKVDKNGSTPSHCPELGPCWVWVASRNGDGYGNIGTRGGRTDKSHRVSWRLERGPIPTGKSVLHHCDNPPCVNPSHLFLGTQTDNMRDCRDKGRMNKACGSAHPIAKLVESDVLAIRAADASGETRASLAARYGVSTVLIGRIVRRLNWTHV